MSPSHFASLVVVVSERIRDLKAADALLLLLNGDLGVGKTQFTKELLESFGYAASEVQSPTFLKVIEHQVASIGKVLHLDLYRLEDVAEVQRLDLAAYETARLIIVEWPDLFLKWLAEDRSVAKILGISNVVEISLEMDATGNRNWRTAERVL